MTSRTRPAVMLLAGLASAGLALSACGSDSLSEGGGATSQPVTSATANEDLAAKVPVGYTCVIGEDVGDAQRALLNRYLGFFFQRPGGPFAPACKLRLVQATPSRPPAPVAGWEEIWRGARPGDKSELFVVYRKA